MRFSEWASSQVQNLGAVRTTVHRGPGQPVTACTSCAHIAVSYALPKFTKMFNLPFLQLHICRSVALGQSHCCAGIPTVCLQNFASPQTEIPFPLNMHSPPPAAGPHLLSVSMDVTPWGPHVGGIIWCLSFVVGEAHPCCSRCQNPPFLRLTLIPLHLWTGSVMHHP